MNVLIFVMTMLMLLSLMTYARLNLYRKMAIYEIFFNNYMKNDERAYMNAAMETQYKKTKGSTKDKKDKNNAPKINATARLSLILLTDKNMREKKPKEWEQTKLLLKNLIRGLYRDEPFFKEASRRNPHFDDDLITALVQTVDALPEKKKIKKATDLANLTLADKDLGPTAL